MFEDDSEDTPVKLPPGHLVDADDVIRYEEVENSLAPPPVRDRSRALSTQKKLDQLEQERERLKRQKEKKMTAGILSKTDGPGAAKGMRMAEFSESDDEDDEDGGSRVSKIISAPAGSSAIAASPAKRTTSFGAGGAGASADDDTLVLSKTEKKLASLGLSSEVDHTERAAAAAASTAAAAAAAAADQRRLATERDPRPALNGAAPAANGGGRGAAAPAAQEEEEPPPPPLDFNDIKTFVLTCIPANQRTPVQCYIKRVRKGLQKLWPYYVLYSQDPDRFLLSGRRRKKNKQSTYLISTDEKVLSRKSDACTDKMKSSFVGTEFTIYDDLSRKSDAYTGKVKSNFVGTEFTIYDAGGNPSRLEQDEAIRMELGVVQYDRNVLGTNGPRRMQVYLPTCSRAGAREVLQPRRVEDCMSVKIAKANMAGAAGAAAGGAAAVHNYIRLVNKTPRWNDSLGAFCLNFQGRVTVASVKNFQLVDEAQQDRIVLQFGKCSDDTFTMDYSYPLCALQAFAICLSSFDHKLACE